MAEHGPPAPDDKTPKRECDARFAMDLDDGVMVNSAALWPLLELQWKDPKKWWKELATAQGRKDYDWSHLAARSFPKRVREKCVQDPSLAVAHTSTLSPAAMRGQACDCASVGAAKRSSNHRRISGWKCLSTCAAMRQSLRDWGGEFVPMKL